MASVHLWSKPTLSTLHVVSCRPDYEKAVVNRVREYFQKNWPWASDEEKDAYSRHDIESAQILCAPRTSEDRGELATAYIVFLFLFDDLVLESLDPSKAEEAVANLKEVILKSQLPRNSIENIAYDLCTRMLAVGNEYSRELAHVVHVESVKYMEDVIKHGDRRASLDQGLDGYLKYRFKDIAFWTVLELCKWGLDLATPEDYLRNDPDFDSLISFTAAHQILVNDLYSYRWEAKLLELEKAKRAAADEKTREALGPITYFVYNAVCVLLKEEGVDEGNVYDKMGEHIHSIEIEFYATLEKLKGRYKDDSSNLGVIKNWVVLLIDIMAGNHIWSAEARRYDCKV